MGMQGLSSVTCVITALPLEDVHTPQNSERAGYAPPEPPPPRIPPPFSACLCLSKLSPVGCVPWAPLPPGCWRGAFFLASVGCL